MGIEFGYQFNQHLRLSFGLDYIPKILFKETIYSNEEILTTDNSTYKVSSFVSMVSIYYDIMDINKFTPYTQLT